MNTYKQVLIPNIKLETVPINTTLKKLVLVSTENSGIPKSKICSDNILRYPPKNNIDVNIQINTILAYSAKKKNTKITAECSVMKPETNSDSASAKSKGALFVSAIHPTKNMRNMGSKGRIKKTAFCASTLIVKFKLPVSRITIKIAELNISS
jgi:hypothetical protein